MQRFILIITFLISSQFSFSQEEISGVTPAQTIQVKETTLIFNGVGLRERWFLDLYAAAVYVTEDREVILKNDESMAITLDIVSGLITAEKFLT